jgi:hypothetical protein
LIDPKSHSLATIQLFTLISSYDDDDIVDISITG